MCWRDPQLRDPGPHIWHTAFVAAYPPPGDKRNGQKRLLTVDPGLAAVLAALIAAAGGVIVVFLGGGTEIPSARNAASPPVANSGAALPSNSGTVHDANPSSTTPAASAPSSVPDQPAFTRALLVPLSQDSLTVVDLSKGEVSVNGSTGDLIYRENLNTNTGEIYIGSAPEYSVGVTSENESKSQCIEAITNQPESSQQPITNPHVGLMFCVATYSSDTGQPAGIALVEVTQPVGSSGDLHLRETYWLNASLADQRAIA